MRLRLRSYYYPLENKIYVSVLEADLIPLHNGRTDERQGTYSAYRGKSGLNLLGLSESVEVPLLFLPRNGMPAFHMISRMHGLLYSYFSEKRSLFLLLEWEIANQNQALRILTPLL